MSRSGYVVIYRGMRSDYAKTTPIFARKRKAEQWAREFVGESYWDQASASVFPAADDANLLRPIARYDNINGKAVRS